MDFVDDGREKKTNKARKLERTRMVLGLHGRRRFNKSPSKLNWRGPVTTAFGSTRLVAARVP
jgi:hypothetical protein